MKTKKTQVHMLKIFFPFLHFMLITLLAFVFVRAEAAQFGHLSYSTYNIGDDIQSIAARRFLPETSLPLNRETLSLFHSKRPVHVLMNGWYMHTQRSNWPFIAYKPPTKSWPPSPSIDPLFVSVHFSGPFLKEAFSEEAIAYLQKHAPIGARDLFTLRELEKRNIPCYFSGCLTLTLENEALKREEIIYAVDVDPKVVNFIRRKANCKVESISHIIEPSMSIDPEARCRYAHALLEKYKRARCVVTSRLHAAMPCLAFETPVLLLDSQIDQERFEGLKELVFHGSAREFLEGNIPFNLNDPPKNSTDYVLLRIQMIETVSQWISQCLKQDVVGNNDESQFSPEEIQPSLHVLIATTGRQSLRRMISSLHPQLTIRDHLTIVFDGRDEGEIFDTVLKDLSQLSCSYSLIREPVSLGFWGHGVRNKYKQLQGDFILHADDDDCYTPDALQAVRHFSLDHDTLYIFKMKSIDGNNLWIEPAIKPAEIGTPMGVVPARYNSKSHWGYCYGGDFDFYNALQQAVPNTAFIDHVIYWVRPVNASTSEK